MLPLPCLLFQKLKSTQLFLGDSPSPAAWLPASAGVRAIWAPPAAPSPESPAAERRAKLGRSEGARGVRDARSVAAAGAALGALHRARLSSARPARCSSRSAAREPPAAPQAQILGCAERGAPASPSQLPPELALSAREKRGSLPTPPQEHWASFHLIRMFLPSD